MRVYFLAAALGVLAAAGCDAGPGKCKPDTLFVRFTIDSGIDADTLGLSVAIGSGAAKSGTFAFPSGKSGSLEVDFPSGYPIGQSIEVKLTGLKSGKVVAETDGKITLGTGCGMLSLDLMAGGGGDGGMMPGDGGRGDASLSLDLSVSDLIAPPDLLAHPVAVIQSAPDLVGFVSKLDATGSTDPMSRTLTYVWHFVAVPAGSHITDSALVPSANADKPTFDPDFGGTYTLELTASAPDGSHGTVSADVVVPTIPVFYQRGSAFDGGDGSLKIDVVRSDGTGAKDVSCELLPDGGVGGGSEASSLATASVINIMHPYSPVPPGKSLLAFATIVPDPAGGDPGASLALADETSACPGNPPVAIDSADTFAVDHFHAWPAFSPNGKRIAYLDFIQNASSSNDNVRVVTVGIDGSGLRVVYFSPNVTDVGPTWIDDTHVAWVEANAINKATDAASATPIVDRDCSVSGAFTSDIINQISATGGTYLLSASTASNAYSLYRMGADCTIAGSTKLAEEGKNGASWNFELSPDGITVAFASNRDQMVLQDGGTVPPTDIFLVPADGSAAPRKLAGDPQLEDTGPHFVAGGRQVIWTANSSQAGLKGGVFIVNLDGTHQRKLFGDSSDNGQDTESTAGGNGGFTFASCSFGTGGDATAFGILLAGACVALVLRRRRSQ